MYTLAFKKLLYSFTSEITRLTDLLPEDDISRKVSVMLLRSAANLMTSYFDSRNGTSPEAKIDQMRLAVNFCHEIRVNLQFIRDSDRLSRSSIDPLMKDVREIEAAFGSWKEVKI